MVEILSTGHPASERNFYNRTRSLGVTVMIFGVVARKLRFSSGYPLSLGGRLQTRRLLELSVSHITHGAALRTIKRTFGDASTCYFMLSLFCNWTRG
jgi:hypothetical protein